MGFFPDLDSILDSAGEIEKILALSDFSTNGSQDETKRPLNIETFKKLTLESHSYHFDAYAVMLMAHSQSVSQIIDGNIRTGVNLTEDDIKLILKKKHSNFVKNELLPGAYSNENLLLTLESFSFQIDLDDISVRTKTSVV